MKILLRTLKKLLPAYLLFFSFLFYCWSINLSFALCSLYSIFCLIFLLDLVEELCLYKLARVRKRSFWGSSGDGEEGVTAACDSYGVMKDVLKLYI